MYGLAQRALQLLQERDLQLEDDVGESRRHRQARGPAKTRKPTTWTWVMAQLVDLLRQYPGGLAESALMTEILSRRMRKQGKPDCLEAGPWDAIWQDVASGRVSAAPGGASLGPGGPATMPPGPQAAGRTCAGGGPGAGSGGGRGGLPGQVPLSALQKGAHTDRLAAAATLSPVVAVAAVTYVECLSQPYGSGPPYETSDGAWLLHLEDGGEGQGLGPAGGAGGGSAMYGGPARGPTASSSVAMYLHSELRLLVMGKTPLLAAGRRVRIAAVPHRSTLAATSPMSSRLLPTRFLVSELPAAMVVGGCWPYVDALRHGGTDPMLLPTANEGALASVGSGCRAVVTGWVVARVARVEPLPPREVGTFDRHRKRVVHLISPTTNGPPCGTPLVLYGDSEALGDLLLPGETIAVYQPVVLVHSSTDAVQYGAPLVYEHGADTVIVVVPTGWPPAPEGQQLPQLQPSHHIHQQDQSHHQQQTAPPPLQQHAGSGEKPALQPASALFQPSSQPQHAQLGFGCLSQKSDGGTAAAATSAPGAAVGTNEPGAMVAAPAAGARCADAGGDGGAAGCGGVDVVQFRTVVVARVLALLDFTHGVGTSQRGRLRALLSDGTAVVGLEMQLERGSKALAHMREGHVVVLLGAVLIPPASAAATAIAAAAAAALQDRHTAAAAASSREPQPPPSPQRQLLAGVLAWTEVSTCCEVFSLTAMPASLTTPPLVRYTCLGALLQALSERDQGRGQRKAQRLVPSGCSKATALTYWPADQLRALAAAARALPDRSAAWRRDVPYVQLPYTLDSAAGGASAIVEPAGRAGGTVSPPRQVYQQQVPPTSPGLATVGAGMEPEGTAPDGVCSAIACVVTVTAANVATHRVHRQCGRPVCRAAAMMDFDFDDDDDDGRVGGGSVAPAAATAAGCPASNPVQDTPSKDQSMDGLWECAFCGLDLVKADLDWQYHGSLTLADVSPRFAAAAPAPASGAAATTAAPPGTSGTAAFAAAGDGGGVVTLPADPEALHGLLGVSAAAFHALNTARRRRVVETCLVDRRGIRRRYVVALYPKPPPQRRQPRQDGAVAAVLCFDGSGAGAHSVAESNVCNVDWAPEECWAVAQLQAVD